MDRSIKGSSLASSDEDSTAQRADYAELSHSYCRKASPIVGRVDGRAESRQEDLSPAHGRLEVG